MERIQPGDKVRIIYNSNFRYPSAYSDDVLDIEARVLHMAAETGDMWEFEDKDGNIFMQNPMSINLDKIVKIDTPIDTDSLPI